MSGSIRTQNLLTKSLYDWNGPAIMDTNWRNNVDSVKKSGVAASQSVRKRVEEAAPDVSAKVRHQVNTTAPEVANRVRAAGKALTGPNPAQPTVAPVAATPPPVTAVDENRIPPAAPLPVDTTPATAPVPPSTRRPTSIRVAYWALVVAAGASVVLAGLGVYGLIELRGTVDDALGADPTGTIALAGNGYVDDVAKVLMGTAAGLGLVFALAYFGVAHALRLGHSWPRPVGTVLAVLSLPVAFFGGVAALIVAAGVVAVAALWTPSARAHANERKAARGRTTPARAV